MTTTYAHDIYACACHETCSWCANAVLDSELKEVPDGARLCKECMHEYSIMLTVQTYYHTEGIL